MSTKQHDLLAGQNRTENGRFRPGTSGNPNGRPRSLPSIEAEIRELHGPQVLGVLEKLREMALAGDVAASKLYLDRVLGPARIPQETSPPLRVTPPTPKDPVSELRELECVDLAALELQERVLGLLKAQVAALEEKAAVEGLTVDEAAALANHLRATSSTGRWYAGVAGTCADSLKGLPAAEKQAAGERMMCAALGITVEQVRALRAQTPGSAAPVGVGL